MKNLNFTNVMTDLIKVTENVIKSNTKNKKLIMVRSVENIGSLSGCLTGWIDAKISEYGRKQAKFLSIEYFSNFDNKNFKRVYTSDLIRAKETAEICLGYDFNINYITDQKLREVYFGLHEGLFYDGMPPEDKKEINKPDHIFQDGESWLDVKYRALGFLDSINRNIKPEEMGVDLVFTHGAFINSVLKSKGVSGNNLSVNGTVTIVNLNQNVIDAYQEALKEYKDLYSESDSVKKLKFFDKFNPLFDQCLDSLVENVEIIYKIPDLSEELL